MVWKGLLRWLLLLCALAGVGVALLFTWANGLTASSLALWALCATLLLLAEGLKTAVHSRRPLLLGLALALLLADAGWATYRLARPAAFHPALPLCTNGACDGATPWTARLVDEGELALFGLYLSRVLLLIGGEEFAELEALLRLEYDALQASPTYAGGANVIPLRSRAGTLHYLQWLPPDRPRAPCIVFLHGFGGQLSVYVKALAESRLGREAVLLAPVLNARGDWWSREGGQVVLELVDKYLPPQADRRQLYLMGLSNGAVGATGLALEPRLGPRFRGAILLSGAAGPPRSPHLPAALLAATGDRDPRFRLAYVQDRVTRLREAGADVTMKVLPGTHFLILSGKQPLGEVVWEWLEGHGGE